GEGAGLHEPGAVAKVVVVAGDAGKEHEVGLVHRAPGRFVRLADRDLFEVPPDGPGHLESVARTSAAPAASARSLPYATSRGSTTMPQFVHGKRRSGGTCFITARTFAATSCGDSIVRVATSIAHGDQSLTAGSF